LHRINAAQLAAQARFLVAINIKTAAEWAALGWKRM
jgi:hypothetical protein